MTRVNTMMEVCRLLAEQENLRVTVIQSAKGAGITGLASLAGGLLGGRRGLLVGGTLGSIASFLMASDFKSVAGIIKNEMTPAQKQELASRINQLFRGIELKDAATGMILMAQSGNLKQTVIREISSYFRDELGQAII